MIQPLLIFTLINGLHKCFSQRLQPMHVHETLNAIPTFNRTLTIGLTIARDSVYISNNIVKPIVKTKIKNIKLNCRKVVLVSQVSLYGMIYFIFNII